MGSNWRYSTFAGKDFALDLQLPIHQNYPISPSIATNGNSIGANQISIGTNYNSIGTNGSSIGTNDPSIGAKNTSATDNPNVFNACVE
jgi:hypothetical protein